MSISIVPRIKSYPTPWKRKRKSEEVEEPLEEARG
jgi:hypothetical protein